MNEVKFVDGLRFKQPPEKAADFVKAKGSINVAELKEYLRQHEGKEWINFDVKVSKAGNWYAALDEWTPDTPKREEPKPASQKFDPPEDSDLPF